MYMYDKGGDEMKKFSVLLLAIILCLFVVGCGKKDNMDNKNNVITCKEQDETNTYTFEKGKLVDYKTSLIKDESVDFKDAIESVNNEYLSNTTKNEDAIKIIKDRVEKEGGTCN